jgi:hypothetical protein
MALHGTLLTRSGRGQGQIHLHRPLIVAPSETLSALVATAAAHPETGAENLH